LPSGAEEAIELISLEEYSSFDATGLADLVARKQVKPEELALTALEAISM
jgi:hypothetical protein